MNKLIDLETMHYILSTLGNVSLPPKAHFVPSKAVYVQLDGGSQEGHATGGFVILKMDGEKIIWAG